jgi:hypothetical protein
MIIWIASYPKSGNTYVRSFLSAYYYSKNGKFDFDLLLNIQQFPSQRFTNYKSYTFVNAAENWINNQKFFFDKNKTYFLKTHNTLENYYDNNFTSDSETLGAIYIVRDPRNIITSMCNHFSLTLDQALIKMTDDKASLSRKTEDGDCSTFTFLGSWSNHYKSWKHNFKFKTLFIKYEDLYNNTYKEFEKIINFIEELTQENKPIDKRKFENSLETTSFDSLKKKENLNGFGESLAYDRNEKTNFFNLGFKNNWQKILPKEISIKITSQFLEELKELNYE